eukprot:364746-Chlamydomonas_euryale.AAC.10
MLRAEGWQSRECSLAADQRRRRPPSTCPHSRTTDLSWAVVGQEALTDGYPIIRCPSPVLLSPLRLNQSSVADGSHRFPGFHIHFSQEMRTYASMLPPDACVHQGAGLQAWVSNGAVQRITANCDRRAKACCHDAMRRTLPCRRYKYAPCNSDSRDPSCLDSNQCSKQQMLVTESAFPSSLPLLPAANIVVRDDPDSLVVLTTAIPALV